MIHDNRESWLNGAAAGIAPLFEALNTPLPRPHPRGDRIPQHGPQGQRPHGAPDLAAAFKRTPGLDQAIGRGETARGVEAMNAAGRVRTQGKDRDITQELGLPPRSPRPGAVLGPWRRGTSKPTRRMRSSAGPWRGWKRRSLSITR